MIWIEFKSVFLCFEYFPNFRSNSLINIHPTAMVDPKAEIGAETAIGPYTVVQDDVVIGDGCQSALMY